MSKSKKALIVVGCCFVSLFFIIQFYFIDSYVDCGCGCCGGEVPTKKFTFAPNDIFGKDKRFDGYGFSCQFAGCSQGTKYYYFNFTKKTD